MVAPLVPLPQLGMAGNQQMAPRGWPSHTSSLQETSHTGYVAQLSLPSLKHLSTSCMGQENPAGKVHTPQLGYKCTESVQMARAMGLLRTPPPPPRHQVFPVAVCSAADFPYDEVSETKRQWADVPI